MSETYPRNPTTTTVTERDGAVESSRSSPRSTSSGSSRKLAGGLLFGSVALLSDAVHMLFDALAYVMAFAAAYVASEYDTSDRWSYGLHRLEPLSAFLNGVLLVPMVAFVLYESYGRFLDPVAIATVPTLAIAVGGLCVNALRCTFWRATR